ncbi:DNA-binding protein RHL1 isoform X2 [Musa acuminata AAA Group]|uniref:DNA-binding protein RHL1 isoform X2 n=1 Tax=Musa acuminata AAA Group TaxID=214697 RepID=UPI0031CF5FCA
MAKRKKESEDEEARPVDPETEEKRRLRSLAFSRKLLRRAPSLPSAPLEPSKAVVRLQGRDLVKRGQRKSRYLFSFPGLLAPLSAGRIGELADLGTKNPVLYLEFPEGRMKLFGTHVYPKNKYLTLQLTKSFKGVTCEDIFESMQIVFADAWWIGQKEENPQELQLEFPKYLSEQGKDAIDYDFKGGAGATVGEQSAGNKPVNKREPLSPETEFEDSLPDDSGNKVEPGTINMATPVRQSARTAGKKLSYAESSGDDSNSSCDAEQPATSPGVTSLELIHKGDEKIVDSCPVPSSVVASTSELVDRKTCSREKLKQTSSSERSKGNLSNGKGTLVQANLSTLFEKVVDKKSKRGVNTSPGTKGPASKRKRAASRKSSEQVEVNGSNKEEPKSSRKKGGKQHVTLQPSEDDSDEDWAM